MNSKSFQWRHAGKLAISAKRIEPFQQLLKQLSADYLDSGNGKQTSKGAGLVYEDMRADFEHMESLKRDLRAMRKGLDDMHAAEKIESITTSMLIESTTPEPTVSKDTNRRTSVTAPPTPSGKSGNEHAKKGNNLSWNNDLKSATNPLNSINEQLNAEEGYTALNYYQEYTHFLEQNIETLMGRNQDLIKWKYKAMRDINEFLSLGRYVEQELGRSHMDLILSSDLIHDYKAVIKNFAVSQWVRKMILGKRIHESFKSLLDFMTVLKVKQQQAAERAEREALPTESIEKNQSEIEAWVAEAKKLEVRNKYDRFASQERLRVCAEIPAVLNVILDDEIARTEEARNAGRGFFARNIELTKEILDLREIISNQDEVLAKFQQHVATLEEEKERWGEESMRMKQRAEEREVNEHTAANTKARRNSRSSMLVLKKRKSLSREQKNQQSGIYLGGGSSKDDDKTSATPYAGGRHRRVSQTAQKAPRDLKRNDPHSSSSASGFTPLYTPKHQPKRSPMPRLPKVKPLFALHNESTQDE